jgi:hypothetical protein
MLVWRRSIRPEVRSMTDYRYVVVLLSDSAAIGLLMGAIARCNASIVESCSNENPGSPNHLLDWQIGFGIKFYVMVDLELFDQLFSAIVRPGTIERVENGYDWMGVDSSDQ